MSESWTVSEASVGLPNVIVVADMLCGMDQVAEPCSWSLPILSYQALKVTLAAELVPTTW